MWLKTEYGDLVNLAHVSALYTLFRGPSDDESVSRETGYIVHARIGDGYILLTRPKNEHEAESVVRRLEWRIKRTVPIEVL